MTLEFDPAKDEANLAKHGVSLKAAERFDWNTALVVEDDRFDYGEMRFYAIGYIGDRLHTLIYAEGSHEDAIRAISLWRSTRNEVRRYEA
ncbi:BrnT family toxin [Phenylobacterium sp.]|uniref:BrnT family toxin n=1 Tax=Phenylobacterium sp. TaxID=1871053 RepID=UPI00301CF3E1